MIHKTLLIAGGSIFAATLFIGWNTFSSYARTSVRIVANSAQDAVPVHFEIERLRTLISDLDAVMLTQRGRLTAQEIDVDYLQEDVSRALSRQNSLEAEIISARTLLSERKDNYTIANTRYSYDQIVDAATAKAHNLKRARSIYQAKSQTHNALSSALQQAHGQLSQAQEQREGYAMRLQQLEASAENIAIRSELITSLDNIPGNTLGNIHTGAFQEVENNFKRLERELAIQQRQLDEQYQSTPRNQSIVFTQHEEKDVLAILDAALQDNPQSPQNIAEPANDTNNK